MESKVSNNAEEKLNRLAVKLGFCVECEQMFSHDLESPFADCACGTTEWYELTPYMQKEKELLELRRKLDSAEQELEILKAG